LSEILSNFWRYVLLSRLYRLKTNCVYSETVTSSWWFRWWTSLVIPTFCVLGVIGNVMTIIIMCQRRMTTKRYTDDKQTDHATEKCVAIGWMTIIIMCQRRMTTAMSCRIRRASRAGLVGLAVADLLCCMTALAITYTRDDDAAAYSDQQQMSLLAS